MEKSGSVFVEKPATVLADIPEKADCRRTSAKIQVFAETGREVELSAVWCVATVHVVSLCHNCRDQAIALIASRKEQVTDRLGYHPILVIPDTASKWRSRLINGKKCWRHNAAIQTSFEGIGVLALFSSVRTAQ